MVLQNPLSGIDSLTHRRVVGPNPIDLNWILEIDWHTHWFHCILACDPWPMQRIAKKRSCAFEFHVLSTRWGSNQFDLLKRRERDIPSMVLFWMCGFLGKTLNHQLCREKKKNERTRNKTKGCGRWQLYVKAFCLYSGLSGTGTGDLALPPPRLDRYFPTILDQHALMLHSWSKRGGKETRVRQIWRNCKGWPKGEGVRESVRDEC